MEPWHSSYTRWLKSFRSFLVVTPHPAVAVTHDPQTGKPAEPRNPGVSAHMGRVTNTETPAAVTAAGATVARGSCLRRQDADQGEQENYEYLLDLRHSGTVSVWIY